MTDNNALILVNVEKLDVSVVFTDDGIQGILQDIESQVMAHVPDIETDQGRKDIASLAYKVARSKTLIDNLGKDVISDWKKKTDRINGFRKTARDFLDDLKDKVRQPLTDWEAEQAKIQEEEERKEHEKIEKRIQDLGQYRVILPFQEVAIMTDEEFETTLSNARSEWEVEKKRLAEEEAARKAEDERLAKQKAEQDAKEAALKKQADELAAQQKAIQDEKNRLEREAFERQTKENAHIQAEKDAKEKAEREEKEKAEKEKRKAEEKERIENAQYGGLERKQHLFKLADAFFDNLTTDDIEYGGIGLDSKRPFGNSYVQGDILEIVGIELLSSEEGYNRAQEDYADDLYGSLIAFLQEKWTALREITSKEAL